MIWIAALVSAGLGVVIGFPTLRVRGDYLAIITLAFGEIIRLVHRESGQPGESPVAKVLGNGEPITLNTECALDLGGPAPLPDMGTKSTS